jgi:hypothetical protein
MSTFTNVTDVELDLQVDGQVYAAPAGGTVTVPDEFDYQLAEQPAFKITKAAASKPTPAPSEGNN